MSNQTTTTTPPPNSNLFDSDSSSNTSEVAEAITPTQSFYKEKQETFQYLVVLCQGLKDDDGDDIINVKKPPFNNKQLKRLGLNIKPTGDMFKEEVVRRHRMNNPDSPFRGPRPRNWTLEVVIRWLDDNPITGEADIRFLKQAVECHRQAIQAAVASVTIEQNSLGLNWTGSEPYLRLIHCVVDDTIKQDYMNRDMLLPGRVQIDNRNSNVLRPNVWEKIAFLWNDRNFCPDTLIFHDLHPYEFQSSERLLFSNVEKMHPATASFVKEKLGSMTKQLYRCIANWERSGQGEGGVDPWDGEDDVRPEFGITQPPLPGSDRQGRTLFSLNSRHSFFNDKEVYLLYFWEVLQRNQLFSSALAILPEDVAAKDCGDSVASVCSSRSSLAEKSITPAKSDDFLKKLTSLTSNFDSPEDRNFDRELKRSEIDERKKERELKQVELAIRKEEIAEKRLDRHDRTIARKQKRIYDLQDKIKVQRVEIWKTRNQMKENALADFLEGELKDSIAEVEALQVELQSAKGQAEVETETPVRSNRRSTP